MNGYILGSYPQTQKRETQFTVEGLEVLKYFEVKGSTVSTMTTVLIQIDLTACLRREETFACSSSKMP